MTKEQLDKLLQQMQANALVDDAVILRRLQDDSRVTKAIRTTAQRLAHKWIIALRSSKHKGLMDIFFSEYGLANREGVALMCLAEALLRVPDAETIDALIEDKIATSDWASHLGQSSSPLVNASTWALMLTGRVLDDGKPLAGVLHDAIKRLGEPVIRQAICRALRELGAQFVLGESIGAALKNSKASSEAGYTFSYDMLGEAASTAADALNYFHAYADAIKHLASSVKSTAVSQNPGISIKLSALFERYQLRQQDRVMQQLVPRVLLLAQMARQANIGFTVDAEEAARLEISLRVIACVLADPSLAGWSGFGIAVQAYGKRARWVIDWFYALAQQLDRQVTVRLVKGAYWDSEIKRAQIAGLAGFPVFCSKQGTDISYLENAAYLLRLRDRIYPQFATHNALTVATIISLDDSNVGYEFQRLHGMGTALYQLVQAQHKIKCRIYAPVGPHKDLLAYLVRRLLENGANSSFIHQLLDQSIPPYQLLRDPYVTVPDELPAAIKHPGALYRPRINSKGWDLEDSNDLAAIVAASQPFATKQYLVRPVTAARSIGENPHTIINPATRQEQSPTNEQVVAKVIDASAADTELALARARPWQVPLSRRIADLNRASDLYQQHCGELIALLMREAGKTLDDAVGELREAVDFLRFYAEAAKQYQSKPHGVPGVRGVRRVFVCISPWNFPLAIFTGQIAAALAAGNAVLAKPAEATPTIAMRAVELLHEAGIPRAVLQFLPGKGTTVGEQLTRATTVNGVCFTGSTATAQRINNNMAKTMHPGAPLIAETGGLNAMIVDSTALPEQAVRDIIASAFQSAGQRCSSCRLLYLQDEVADRILAMLFGAMDALLVGDPWQLATDIGPVINPPAQAGIANWIAAKRTAGRVLKELPVPASGCFIAPTVIDLTGDEQLQAEIFGPVLHVIRYQPHELAKVIAAINSSNYGLTFGMHSRIDARINYAVNHVAAGNIYINRNQIGAVVGSQPFGGHRLSGTGPKAGGPLYLSRFYDAAVDNNLPTRLVLPGPTGESNQWKRFPCGNILCLGPTAEDAAAQVALCRAQGCTGITALRLAPAALSQRDDYTAVVYWGSASRASAYRIALAQRQGPILPLITAKNFASHCWLEQHICIDTTAAGGNTELLAGQGH